MSNLIRSISQKLGTAGIEAQVRYAKGVISIEAECPYIARDVLGFDAFTGYIADVEIIIL
jgi:hypothetical protein